MRCRLGSRRRVGTREAEKERAVRMVRQLRKELGTDHGTIGGSLSSSGSAPSRCGAGCSQAEIDDGVKPGVTSAEAARIKELEQENRELRRANAILRSASAFFAAELDRPQK